MQIMNLRQGLFVAAILLNNGQFIVFGVPALNSTDVQIAPRNGFDRRCITLEPTDLGQLDPVKISKFRFFKQNFIKNCAVPTVFAASKYDGIVFKTYKNVESPIH